MANPGTLTPADLAGLMASFNDVTARLERTHDELKGEVARLTRELTDANAALERSRRLAALGEMAAGIAHEVRNPVGSIRLYARMLEEDLAGSPRQAGVARKIGGAAVELDRIVRDVLAFAREIRVRPHPCDASDLLGRALDECAAAGIPGWGSIEVVREDLRREPVRVRGDDALLVRAMANLIRNAAEAMCESGSPVRRLTLSAEQADEGGASVAVLVVRDTGPGVSPDAVARMFNPFFTTRASGTGLGLAIVHRIADAHRGRVAIGNEPAGGARAELVVPGASMADVEPEPKTCGGPQAAAEAA